MTFRRDGEHIAKPKMRYRSTANGIIDEPGAHERIDNL